MTELSLNREYLLTHTPDGWTAQHVKIKCGVIARRYDATRLPDTLGDKLDASSKYVMRSFMGRLVAALVSIDARGVISRPAGLRVIPLS